jgi:hypothetical protein
MMKTWGTFILVALIASPILAQVRAVEAGSPEAAQRIAEYQNRLAQDADEWKSVKKLTKLSKLSDKPRDQGECLAPDELQVGKIGFLEYWETKVIQVTGKESAILMIANPRHPPVWLSGVSTQGLVDGQKVRLVGPIKVVSTKTYQTAGGVSKTVNVIELLDEKQLAALEAEAKQAAEDALHRDWSDINGQKLFSAKFLEFKNNKARFEQKGDKQIVEHSISQLSKADQQWIKDELKKRSTKKK